jgi:hypothetical protein
MDRAPLARISWALKVTIRRHPRALSDIPWDFAAALYDCDTLSGGAPYRAVLQAFMAARVPLQACSDSSSLELRHRRHSSCSIQFRLSFSIILVRHSC